MMRADKRTLTAGAIVLAAILFLCLNILVANAIKPLRLDLTEDALFTLSDGTRQVLRDIDEPIQMRFYLSRALADESPVHANYGERVREVLEHYVRLADGRLELEIYDPEPFSAIEDEAVAFGLHGIPLTSAGDLGYFGLAATNSTDDREVVPLFDQRRESFLEYDLTRLVYNLANPKKKVIGLVDSFLMEGDPMRGQGPWAIIQQMRQFFEVRNLGPDFSRIPEDVDVLLMVHPRGLKAESLYAVDQYVMHGGKAMIMVDPNAESMLTTPRGREPGITESDLGNLLDSWGVIFDSKKFVGDATTAMRVSTSSGNREVTARYLAWLGMGPANFDQQDVVTAQLNLLVMAGAGAFAKKEDASIKLEPLILSGDKAAHMDASEINYYPDPVALLKKFVPEDKRFTLAGRLKGTVKSAFPDGPPEVEAEPASEEGDKKKKDREALAEAHLAESAAPVHLVLVGDADMLANRFWLDQQSFLGQQISIPTSNNADFVINTLDNLMGSEGLISLRSRGKSSRPFHVLEGIQRAAEVEYRQTEQGLLAKLEETEKKLGELQTRAGPEGGVILTDEQKDTIQEFRSEMLSIRKQLRDVQHALRSDIEQINTMVKVVNIWSVPLLISLLAIVIALIRRSRFRQRATAH